MSFWPSISSHVGIQRSLAQLLRNDEIIKAQLSLLIAGQPKLSPGDQAKLNTIYDTATKDSAKIDAAKK